jgi:hypothetical protein
MEKYNLLGQRGIAGERNPDQNLSDDVATYMYDFPPGQGDNKGVTSTNKPVAKQEVEQKKIEIAAENPQSYIAGKEITIEPPTAETPVPKTVTAPALTTQSKSKVVALQKELGVTADGIVGPQTIAAAKAKIANSKTYSEVIGLAEKYDLILNVDKYKTATKIVSAPSAPRDTLVNKELVARTVDLFTTTLFPPTALGKSLTGEQEITGLDKPTSVEMAGEWVMIDREGFTIFSDKDVLRGTEKAKEPRWYNTKTGQSISIVDKEGRPVLPEFAEGKPVDKSIINPVSLGRWEQSFNDYLQKNLIADLKEASPNIASIFSNVGVVNPIDIDKLDEIGLKGLANELGIDIREYMTKPTYQEIQAGKKPVLNRDELSAGLINYLTDQKGYEDYNIIKHEVPEVEETLTTTQVSGPEQVQSQYPKVLVNDQGVSAIVKNPTEEYYAKLGGYLKTLDPKQYDEAPGTFVNLAIDQAGNLVQENTATGESTIIKTLTPEEKDTGKEIEKVVPPTIETVETDEGVVTVGSPTETTTGVTQGISGGTNQLQQPPQGGIQLVDLLNAPDGAYVWNVDGNLYVAYEVPGSRGEVYDGPPLFMAYEVPGNDLVAAGLWSPEAPPPFISQLLKEDFDAITILQSGNTDQLTSLIDHPFASFAEQLETQIAVAPWLADIEAVGLLAEAALEGRQVSEAEWQGTTWWKEHSESERNWLVTYNSDPATAQQLTTDAQLAVANSLQAAGVSNAPEAIVNWIADKYVSGQWSQTYTTEQVSLFADPYATGKRDENFENYLSSTAITGVDRTTEREREVRELYSKWLGPSLGKLTDKETAEIAGRLRDDPDYQDQLIQSLKQSRLAAFSNYTNPELTYEDIARPWRNLTTSVWGQTADETQGWWQEMMKSNDYATAQTTLREKGLELDITQVTQDATQALQQALGQGTVSQLGVNV